MKFSFFLEEPEEQKTSSFSSILFAFIFLTDKKFVVFQLTSLVSERFTSIGWLP